MTTDEQAYLEYELSNGTHVMLAFDDINQCDGCHISLDMYKLHLGAVDEEVLKRILLKFGGRIMSAS